MWRTEGHEQDTEFIARDLNICRYCQSELDQRAPFIRDALVVRRYEINKVAVSLIRDHFDEVSQEFTLWFELDHVFSGGDGDGIPGGYFSSLLFEFRDPIEGFSHALRELFSGSSVLSPVAPR
jgi:hypothetical protein